MVGDEGNPGGRAHHHGIDPESVCGIPQEEQQDDQSQFHEGIRNIHQGDGPETLVHGEQALERDVGDAQAGDDRGNLEDEHRVGLLSGRDVQFVVDVP